MSPTRRDILRSIAGVAVALPVAALPTISPAHAAPVTEPTGDAAWNLDYLRRELAAGKYPGVTMSSQDGMTTFKSPHGKMATWMDAAGGRHLVMHFTTVRNEEMFGSSFICPLILLKDVA